MRNAVKLRQSAAPRQQGELARLKVVNGPDQGFVYVIAGPRVSIGRGDENDIVISDLKASRLHAEILASQQGEWTLKDLASANGVLLNGKQVKSSPLRAKDLITLGETVLEFVSADLATSILMAPPKDLLQLKAEQAVLEDQKNRVRSLGKAASLPEMLSTMRGPGGTRSKLNTRVVLIVLLGVALVLFVLPDEKSKLKPENAAKARSGTGEASRDLSSYLPSQMAAPANKTADTFFKIGFREYVAGNYLRAKSQFDLALQITPEHRLARLYRENCDLAIKEEVEFHKIRGSRSFEAGKIKDARGHYESVLRLLHSDQSNPSFIEARDQLDKIRKYERGES